MLFSNDLHYLASFYSWCFEYADDIVLALTFGSLLVPASYYLISIKHCGASL
jgi:hypothetical protein